MDPPSTQLIERLHDLRLCRPGDLRRCRPLVRRLARDLPTFDSVWIDALVQTRRLTPFQARILDSPEPDRLAVGPFVLLRQLGNDGRISRFLAREKEGRSVYLLSQVRSHREQPTTALDRVREVIHALSVVRVPSLNPPLGCALQDDLVTVVSPHVPGPTFAELLVRRGRFPDGIVRDVAAQLSAALASLESAQLVHGDIRPRNIVLGRNGRAVLLHPGLLAAVDPELTIHAELPPDAYDTVAPERIGTGAPASTSSDMYGLGCLLFELVAGRPPFPQGDPLAKLAAHQSQSVPDVRRFAPDTPDALAELLNRLTARDPQQRPESFAELSRSLRRRGTARRLRRFEATFQHPVRIRRTALRKSPARRAVVPLLLLFLAANLALLHAGARTELLSIADTFSKSIREAVQRSAAEQDSPVETEQSTRQPFPTDVVDGVLTLEGPGPYAAGRLAAVGPLVIRGNPAEPAVIVIEDEPLELWAEQIQLENVILRSDGREATPSTLLSVNCQDLGLRNCTFACDDADAKIAGFTWTALDESSAAGPRVVLMDCLFARTESSLRLKSSPASVMLQNVLQLSGGALIEFQGQPVTTRTIAVTLRQSTLRESEGLVRFATPPATATPPLILTLENSALDLVSGRSALVQFAGDPPADWQTRIRLTGQDSMVRPQTTLAAVSARSGGSATPLEAGRMAVDGLFAAEFSFAGANVLEPADAQISESPLIGHSLAPPGADVGVFSHTEVEAYNDE